MKAVTFLCIVSVLGGTSYGLPSKKNYPQPGYLIGGYYRNPSNRQDYLPSMSAVVTKDVVATNTFSGFPQDPAWNNAQDPGWNTAQDPAWNTNTDSKEEYTERIPTVPEIPHRTPEITVDENTSGESSSTVNKNVNKTNRKGKKPYKPQEDEDDAPWWLSKSGSPSFTSFFPINISGGGSGGVRRRSGGSQDDNDIPYGSSGSATAIANSFSTGRGGVATSHATSFGDPFLAAMFLKNGFYNLKGHGQRQGATY